MRGGSGARRTFSGWRAARRRVPGRRVKL